MFRSQFIESSIVCLKVCSLCHGYTVRLHSTACQTWRCLHVYGDVFWMCCWGFQAQCFGKWCVSVMRCKNLNWVGSCRKSNLNLWTQKWLSCTVLTWKVISRGKNRKVTKESCTYRTRKWKSCHVCEDFVVSRIFAIAAGVYKLCSCVLLLAVCFCC
jgi:hypothetical protein